MHSVDTASTSSDNGWWSKILFREVVLNSLTKLPLFTQVSRTCSRKSDDRKLRTDRDRNAMLRIFLSSSFLGLGLSLEVLVKARSGQPHIQRAVLRCSCSIFIPWVVVSPLWPSPWHHSGQTKPCWVCQWPMYCFQSKEVYLWAEIYNCSCYGTNVKWHVGFLSLVLNALCLVCWLTLIL